MTRNTIFAVTQRERENAESEKSEGGEGGCLREGF